MVAILRIAPCTALLEDTSVQNNALIWIGVEMPSSEWGAGRTTGPSAHSFPHKLSPDGVKV